MTKESPTRSGRRGVRLALAAAAVATMALGASCGGPKGSQGDADGAAAPAAPRTDIAAPTPAEFAEGERRFDANCARCHGSRGAGTDQGPPLVHIIYEPHHHSDAAFQMAAANGVRAHHWTFGDMPPASGVTPEQVAEIVAYVRWLQRQAGIE